MPTMAVNPVQYLVVPRLIASTVMMPLLTMVFNVCGILGAYAFLLENPKATRADVIASMDAHLCRCGAHVRIVEAIESAAAAMKGGSR